MFWDDVAGPLVPAQIAAGTKGSRPKARFPLVHMKVTRSHIYRILHRFGVLKFVNVCGRPRKKARVPLLISFFIEGSTMYDFKTYLTKKLI
jgi:hypothetical protein